MNIKTDYYIYFFLTEQVCVSQKTSFVVTNRVINAIDAFGKCTPGYLSDK